MLQQVVDDRTLAERLWRRLADIRATYPYVAAELEAILEAEAGRPLAPREVLARDARAWAVEFAARETGVASASILGRTKSPAAVRARWLAMALCRARYGWRLTEIGRAFRLDHTTVSHGLRKAQAEPTWHLVEAELRRRGA